MSNRVGAVALCFASVLMLVAATSMAASPESAGPRAGGADAVLGPVSSQLTYQGRLTDASGVPLSGTFNVTFQRWDDPAGGGQIGADIVRSGVSVSEGGQIVARGAVHRAVVDRTSFLDRIGGTP